MPVTIDEAHRHEILQREQYALKGLGRTYWDYRDNRAFSFIDQKDQVIIDLGCGEGISLEKLSRLYPDRLVLGLDLLDENARIAHSYKLRVACSDIYEIPIADNRVDFVLLSEVIEHLNKPERAIAEIHRILKKNGTLLIIFPNDRNFFLARFLTFRFKAAFFDPGHLRQWTHRHCTKILREHGFEVTKAVSLPFFFWNICLHGLVLAKKD